MALVLAFSVLGARSGLAPPAEVPTITTVAGGLAQGPVDRFFQTLTRVTVSGSTVYATDYALGVIRAIDLTTGSERVVAGTGSHLGSYGDGGPGTAAGLSNPMGIDADGQGNLYVADNWNRRVRKVTPTGTISTIAGGGPSGVRGDGTSFVVATVSRGRNDLTLLPAWRGGPRSCRRARGVSSVGTE